VTRATNTQEKLRQLWLALLDSMLSTVRNPPEGGIDATRMNVIRLFLADSGVNIRTLSEARAGLEQLAALSAGFSEIED
jgi:hypothetical protein